MKKGKWREHISCILYLFAFFAFLGGITAKSSHSMLDFSSMARWICCGFAAICVIAGAIVWKAKDARGKKIKIGIMIGALVVIIVGGVIDSKTDHTSAAEHRYNSTAMEEAVEHDLSKDGELLISETVEKDEIFMISPNVCTNSEEISFTNNSTEDLTIYIYSFGDMIRQMSLAAGKTKAVDGLNGAFPYKIGVSVDVSQIELVITE